jgi:tRNA A-37 threonylcarbamoyl transferase component Bud32
MKNHEFTYFPPTKKQFYFSAELLKNSQFPLMYVPLTLKAKVLWMLLKISHLRNFFSESIDQLPKPVLDQLSLIGNLNDNLYQINLGTPGPEQKTTIIKHSPDQRTTFYKLGKKELAKQLIENEYHILSELQGKFHSPKVFEFRQENDIMVLETSYLLAEKLSETTLNESILGLLIEMSKYNTRVNNNLSSCFSHGDFCPWNLLKHKEQLYIIDWEMASERPLGYDLFTYIFQTAILLDKTPDFNKLIETNRKYIIEYFSKHAIKEVVPYLKAFLEQKIDAETNKSATSILTKQYQILHNRLNLLII